MAALAADQQPPFASVGAEEKELAPNHVLIGHTHAADAEQAALDGNPSTARESHLAASQCFLTAARTCSDLVVRRGLITLSRAHSQAAAQAALQAERSLGHQTRALQGHDHSQSRHANPDIHKTKYARSIAQSWARPTGLSSPGRGAIHGPIPEDQESDVAQVGIGGHSASEGGQEDFALECSVLAPRKSGVHDHGHQPRPRPSQRVDEFFALRKALQRIGSRVMERTTCAPDKTRAGAVGSVLGESFFDLGGEHKQHAAIDLSASIQHIKLSVHRPVGMPRRKLPSGESLLSASARLAPDPHREKPATHAQPRRSGGASTPSEVEGDSEVDILRAQLVRCMQTTRQLHDENLKLLQERETWEAIRRQNSAVQQNMRDFKAEYSEKFEQVRDRLVAFREEYPHLANPAADVGNSSEWTRLLQLKRGYEKKSKKLQEAQSAVRHLEDKLKKAETTVQRYQRVFMKIKADQQAARRSRGMEAVGRNGAIAKSEEGSSNTTKNRAAPLRQGGGADGHVGPTLLSPQPSPNYSPRTYAKSPAGRSLPTMPEEATTISSGVSSSASGLDEGGAGDVGAGGGRWPQGTLK